VRRSSRQRGQALPLALALGLVVVLGGVALFALGRVQLAAATAQTAADVAAVSAARELRARLWEVALAGRDRQGRWRQRLATVAGEAARASGGRVEGLELPGPTWPPTAVEVVVSVPAPAGARVRALARAGLVASAPLAGDGRTGWATGGGYSGPLVYRDGKPTCPAVAAAFDLMDAAAHASGVDLVVVSGFRSDAEQAVLFARHPDPKWVAPPGRSRHRDATELDLNMNDGGGGAYAWLSRHGSRFGFAQRYSWEPWHWGYLPGCGAGAAPRSSRPPAATPGALPAWVPASLRPAIAAAASANGVAPVLLAAVLRAESGFDPRAVSSAGAQGIAQLMPATARGLGVRDPFDPGQAIPAAARLLGGHLRAFGSVPLALAAYNAGPGAVRRHGGVPPYRETQTYVARVMALAGGAGALATDAGSDVVLLRAGDRFV
jgi:hypothetical protein